MYCESRFYLTLIEYISICQKMLAYAMPNSSFVNKAGELSQP